jgi:hypothetical protein
MRSIQQGSGAIPPHSSRCVTDSWFGLAPIIRGGSSATCPSASEAEALLDVRLRQRFASQNG